MPLKKGSSRKTVSANVKRLVHEYEDTGAIGASHPASKRKAIRQAVAIALTKAGRSRKQAPAGGGNPPKTAKRTASASTTSTRRAKAATGAGARNG